MKIARRWVSEPFCVDGWRLDVAADLGHSSEFNHKFWKDFRANVKLANPEAVILAEHYGDPSSWLQGDEWDTIMNYDAFMEPLTWFLTGMEKHSDSSKQRALRRRRELFPLDALSHEPDAGTVGDDGDEPALESRSQPFSDENEPDGRTNRNDGCGDGIDRRELRSLPRGGYRSDDMAGSADAVLWR